MAKFVPATQRCDFATPEGMQSNNNTGTATLHGGVLSLDVEGAFSATPFNGPPFSGNFAGTWTFTKR